MIDASLMQLEEDYAPGRSSIPRCICACGMLPQGVSSAESKWSIHSK